MDGAMDGGKVFWEGIDDDDLVGKTHQRVKYYFDLIEF